MKITSKVLTILILYPFFSIGQISFEEKSETLGANIDYGNINLGIGISFFDYNGDGLDDITLPASQTQDFQFLKNTGGAFVVDGVGISSDGDQSRQSLWVDYDNDGDLDFFYTSDQGLTRLFNNDGAMNFSDVTTSCGFTTAEFKTFGGSWGDYNNDGFLDLFITIREGDLIDPNILYRNNGDGTFSNVTTEAGIENIGFLSLCSSWFDYDKDGYQDLYVANDKFYIANVLYHNNGDGTFENVSEISGTDIFIEGMSTTIGDYNKDGWLDIYITNTYPPEDDGVDGSALLKNNGDGTFTNVATETGANFYSTGWGTVFIDADNDTDEDIFVSGSEDGTNYPSSAFYENTGNSSFSELFDAGFEDDNRRSYGNAIGDIENDGFPDIVVINTNEQDISLWSNTSTLENNWLKVKLEGTESNRMGIGSWIEISIDGNVQYNYTLCGEGYLSQNSATEFFGLGSAVTIDYVKVTWLSGQIDYIENVDINQTLEIVEGSSPLSISDNEVDNIIDVYPNPVKDLLYIHFEQSLINGSIKLFDINGKLLRDLIATGREMHMDVDDLPNGMYFLNIKDDSYSSIIKFIKE